jgi:hypothetical protein
MSEVPLYLVLSNIGEVSLYCSKSENGVDLYQQFTFHYPQILQGYLAHKKPPPPIKPP